MIDQIACSSTLNRQAIRTVTAQGAEAKQSSRLAIHLLLVHLKYASLGELGRVTWALLTQLSNVCR